MENASWYTKEKAEPTEEYGTLPEKRSIQELLQKGFFIIDKPFGPTSNQISHWVKEELNLQKTGHFGTLDPNATGILPVGLNQGTRVNNALSQARKEYIFLAELEEEKDKETIEEKLQSFQGVNKQVPPEKSAVKQQEREREVYEIELIETDGREVLGKVKCESGFYVRVLIEQLGEKLDTEAEMTELRRTQQGQLHEEDTNTLQDIVDAYHFYNKEDREEALREVIHPIEKAVSHLRKVVVKDSAVNAIANGADLGATGISQLQDGISKGEQIAIMTLKGELIALAQAQMTSEEMYDSSDTAATLNSVHMNPEKYPKRWKQE